MLCSGPRSPPAAWSGAGGPFYNGRCDGPSPTTYTPPTFVDEINSKPASTAGTFSWCVVLHDGVGATLADSCNGACCVCVTATTAATHVTHTASCRSTTGHRHPTRTTLTLAQLGSPMARRCCTPSWSTARSLMRSRAWLALGQSTSPTRTRLSPRFDPLLGSRSEVAKHDHRTFAAACADARIRAAPTMAAGCPPGNPVTPPPVARRCLAPWCSVSLAHLPRLVEPHPRPGRAGPLTAVAAGPLPVAAPAPHGPRHADHHPGSPRRGVQGTQCRARRVPTYRRCGWDRCSSCHRTT